MALEAALEAALKIYDKERRHSAPVDVVAQHMGYKNATNGAALQALASLKYYGLVERNQPGMIQISKDVESYSFAPSADLRGDLLIRWLKSPPIFSELLDKYEDQLPSDATIKFDLIQRGFLPDAADSVVSTFRQSINFARYFEHRGLGAPEEAPVQGSGPAVPPSDASSMPPAPNPEEGGGVSEAAQGRAAIDRIPVRLTGGRRAWLEIPTPFHRADKDRIKAQIDLLLTVEDEDADA